MNEERTRLLSRQMEHICDTDTPQRLTNTWWRPWWLQSNR